MKRILLYHLERDYQMCKMNIFWQRTLYASKSHWSDMVTLYIQEWQILVKLK